jgi:CyaY protein
MSSQITESQYHELVDQVLLSIEEALDDFAVDIDTESAEGILTLTFENGTKMVLNKQEPLLQLWVATKFNGHHFNYADGLWIDERGAGEFWAFLNEAMTVQAEQPVVLGIN